MTSASDPGFWKDRKRNEVNKALFARERTQAAPLTPQKSEQQDKFDRFIDPTEKDQLFDVVSEGIIDIMWNKIFYLSSFATQSVTTSSSTEDLTAREPDTSENVYLAPDQDSRLRISFYLNTGQTNSIVYIGLGTSSSQSAPTAIASPNNSFAGVKIVQSIVNMASYNGETDTEKLIVTQEAITDNTTHLIEFRYATGQSVVVFIDNKRIGEIAVPQDFAKKTQVFYPYITSVSSVSGSVNMTLESYEFIQNR